MTDVCRLSRSVENLKRILRQDLHLRKNASKWVPHALTEVDKMDTISNMAFTNLKKYISIVHTSKST